MCSSVPQCLSNHSPLKFSVQTRTSEQSQGGTAGSVVSADCTAIGHPAVGFVQSPSQGQLETLLLRRTAGLVSERGFAR